MNRASVFEWHKTFKEGRESVRDDESFMCVLSIKVPIRKKSGDLFNDPHIYTNVYIYIYIYVYIYIERERERKTKI